MLPQKLALELPAESRRFALYFTYRVVFPSSTQNQLYVDFCSAFLKQLSYS